MIKQNIKELKAIVQLLSDLSWDFDRMSRSGQETYNELAFRIQKFLPQIAEAIHFYNDASDQQKQDILSKS